MLQSYISLAIWIAGLTVITGGSGAQHHSPSCVYQSGVEILGADLYGADSPNRTADAGTCCSLCRTTAGCAFWTFDPQCSGTNCCWLKSGEGMRQKASALTSVTGSAELARNQTLLPMLFTELPTGSVRPTGWLRAQLKTQATGLSGHLGRFWSDVNQSTWLIPENRWQETHSDRGGNFPYWLNGLVPMIYMGFVDEIIDSTGYNLTEVVEGYLDTLLLQQRINNNPMFRNFNLGTWNVIRSLLLWMGARPDLASTIMPFVLGYVEAAQGMLLEKGGGDNTVCTQCDADNPDCTQVVGGSHCWLRNTEWMWILQMLLDMDTDKHIAAVALTPSQRELIWTHMKLAGDWGFDFESMYRNPCNASVTEDGHPGTLTHYGGSCFPTAGCNGHKALHCEHGGLEQHVYMTSHGVSAHGMPLKEGAVRWRMSGEQRHRELSHLKIDQLTRYHGQPTGQFSADEHLAGREPNRGVELCTIVETVYSLNVMHRVQGDVAFADRAERIVFNALPAALTGDMWSHNYISTINEVFAERSPSHPWGIWYSENATIYGLGDKYTGVTPCCTANHNQGWPKLTMAAVLVAPDDAIVVSLILPMNASMPQHVGGGAQVEVVTEYPFGDEVRVRVRSQKPVPLRVRVPVWATGAEGRVDGGSFQSLENGTYHEVLCPAGLTEFVLRLNPDIRVEFGWGADGTNAAAVVRGPLLFALPVEEQVTELRQWACFDDGCSRDVSFDTNSSWSFALVLDGADPSVDVVVNPSTLRLQWDGLPAGSPFASAAAAPLRIAARVRPVAWGPDARWPKSPESPPPSPIDCGLGCGPEQEVTLVPFGATRLRVGMLPWTADDADRGPGRYV